MRPSDDIDRGQAHTLESVVGAILLLTAIAFALQVTIVTPLSASTSSQHIEGQQREVAQGVLANAAEEGALKEAVLYWNETETRFHNTDTRRVYTDDTPDIQFGNMLERAFGQEGIAYNVYISSTSSGGTSEEEMVVQGTPSDNAVSATRTIAIQDDDRLINADGSLSATTVSEADIYIDDPDEDTGLYNVVRVEVVVWRI